MKDPKAFLKKVGMQFDVKPTQIDNRFHKSLTPEKQEELEEIWAMMSMNMATGCDLYPLPETLKQASILFSHDASRYRASLAWLRKVAMASEASSIFEVGCGAGFASAFLQSEIAGASVSGIDAMPNLVKIASELTGSEFTCGDYIKTEGHPQNDLVICDFGFDLVNFHPSRKPHGTAVAGQFTYCPGCSEDFVPQFAPYFAAWKSWMQPMGRLAVVGRFQNVGMVLAAGRAAANCGLGLVDSMSTKLRVDTPAGAENFPALVFEGTSEPSFTSEDAARVYAR